ncbi:hypothetical protein [Bacillus sp. Marseille-P3661]|uniref:hypothetical protein n=1 Tax=Bacillus sp. Marseille-P3661 TaxID=1936234 RepID=UPI000C819F8D|nr:hypothetical protein [Bacillus sp. Marseille-P3661]
MNKKLKIMSMTSLAIAASISSVVVASPAITADAEVQVTINSLVFEDSQQSLDFVVNYENFAIEATLGMGSIYNHLKGLGNGNFPRIKAIQLNGEYFNYDDFAIYRTLGGTLEGVLTDVAKADSSNYSKLKFDASNNVIGYEPLNPPADEAPILTGISMSTTDNTISPEITQTTAGTTITFNVEPTAVYTSGTASLSEDADYVLTYSGIKVGDHISTTSNLMEIAMNLLDAAGGDSSDGVSGQTLIDNSGFTVTLTDAANNSTTYTVVFQ